MRKKIDDKKFADIDFDDFPILIFKVSQIFIEEEGKLSEKVCYS